MLRIPTAQAVGSPLFKGQVYMGEEGANYSCVYVTVYSFCKTVLFVNVFKSIFIYLLLQI